MGRLKGVIVLKNELNKVILWDIFLTRAPDYGS